MRLFLTYLGILIIPPLFLDDLIELYGKFRRLKEGNYWFFRIWQWRGQEEPDIRVKTGRIFLICLLIVIGSEAYLFSKAKPVLTNTCIGTVTDKLTESHATGYKYVFSWTDYEIVIDRERVVEISKKEYVKLSIGDLVKVDFYSMRWLPFNEVTILEAS